MIPVERLEEISLFAPLNEEARAQIARLFHRVPYQLGETVFAQGKPGDALYILESGVLRVRQMDARGQEHVIDYYQPPRYFGETSLLTGIPHDATLDVFSQTAELFILPKNEWDAMLDQHPEIKEHLQIRPDIRQKLAARPFKWLAEGEYVIVYARRHFFALILMLRLPALIAVGLLLLALLVTAIEIATRGELGFLLPLDTLLWFGLVIWVVGTFGWAILDWYNDSLIVTNKRVIHFERIVGLFEEREEAPIEQVSNVNETAQTLAARLFDYTNIRIETAGHQIDINFSYVPRRLRIRQSIFEQIERARSRSEYVRREQLRANIRKELQEYLLPPQVGAPALSLVSPILAQAAPTPVPIRQRRRSALGKRLNELLGLQIEEQGRITWRKHWFDLFGRIAKWLGVTVVFTLLGPAIFFVTREGASLSSQLLLLAIWGIAVSIAGFLTWYHYEDWHNDIYQLTDERVVDIERSPFRLKERLVETTLERIQNVSYNKPNLIANFFNYGDLMIETAGGQGRLVFKNVPNPQWAAQEIFRRRDAYRERQRFEQARRNQTDFLDWFLEYHRLLQHKGDVGALPAKPNTPSADTAPSDEHSDSQTPQ
ncbi:MAG: cyclic nucleotide-binding domain-containing protein [Chloroflexota bacterium]